MQEHISRTYYWPGLISDCTRWCKECETCQRHKRDVNQKKRVPTAEWNAPTTPFHTVGIDFIGQLTTTNSKNSAIMTVIDRLTKRAYFIPCPYTVDAAEAAKLFIKHVFKNEGLPTQILSDRGSLFTSEFWKALWSQLGVTLALSSAYHPQTDGVTVIKSSYSTGRSTQSLYRGPKSKPAHGAPGMERGLGGWELQNQKRA